LLVQATGRKGWAVRYRLGGKTHKHTVGPYRLRPQARPASSAYIKDIHILKKRPTPCNAEPIALIRSWRDLVKSGREKVGGVIHFVAIRIITGVVRAGDGPRAPVREIETPPPPTRAKPTAELPHEESGVRIERVIEPPRPKPDFRRPINYSDDPVV
jgi:hypothetical protein